MERLEDAELVALSRRGDARAFDRLAARWGPDLYRFFRRCVGNREDARDLCQETMVRAFLNLDRLRHTARFKTWLYQIALNLVRDRSRSARSRAAAGNLEEQGPDGLELARRAGGFEAPDRRAERRNVAEILADALAGLSEEHRVPILLREYQGLTSEEIGAVLGIPPATVRTRIYYGLKALRRELEKRGIARPGA